MSLVNKFKSLLKADDKPVSDLRESQEEYEQIFNLAKKRTLTPEKKQELETLYAQLFSKSDNAASGQLQFLGLDQIKHKMGAKWPRLQEIVHKTAEEVIAANISEHDIHFLYKDDRYVIIFTQSTIEEINVKIAYISAEITRRFALLDEEELKTIGIKEEVKKIDAATFMDSELPDMLTYLYKQYNPKSTGVYTKTAAPSDTPRPVLEHGFLPLYDVKKNAPAMYLCLARETGDTREMSEAYKALFKGKALAERTATDIEILENVFITLQTNGKMSMLCPVQHETLYNAASYEEYKALLQKIPGDLRRTLIFLVTNSENYSLPAKDPYWFVSFLKQFGCSVFIDIPMKNISFAFLKNCADGVGTRLENASGSEESNLHFLTGFASKASFLKIKKTFAFDVNTPSAAATLAGMGFDYLGGPAISDLVAAPEDAAPAKIKF